MGFAEKFLEFLYCGLILVQNQQCGETGGYDMNLYLRKDGRCELKTQNGKNFDGKRLFLYVLARTKEQYIELVQAICQRNRPHGTCPLSMADLFSEWYRSILHRLKKSTAANYTMTSKYKLCFNPYSGYQYHILLYYQGEIKI